MRSPEDVHEDIEGDRSSREAEVRLIERLVHRSESHEEKEMLKRSLILLLYAHLEGFCKFALLSYTSALNALELRCGEAAYPVAAAGLSKVFAALRNSQSKHGAFKKSLPEDTQLHLAAREQDFIKSYEKIICERVILSDALVDTKSNLSSDILKKMLFQLGLNYPAVDEYGSKMAKLLGMRNAIAHGDRLKIPSDKDIRDFTTTTFEVMSFLQNEVYRALKSRIYPRAQIPLRDDSDNTFVSGIAV